MVISSGGGVILVVVVVVKINAMNSNTGHFLGFILMFFQSLMD